MIFIISHLLFKMDVEAFLSVYFVFVELWIPCKKFDYPTIFLILFSRLSNIYITNLMNGKITEITEKNNICICSFSIHAHTTYSIIVHGCWIVHISTSRCHLRQIFILLYNCTCFRDCFKSLLPFHQINFKKLRYVGSISTFTFKIFISTQKYYTNPKHNY